MKKRTKIILSLAVAAVLCTVLGYYGWNWYDANVDRSGWRERNGVTVYTDFHGKPISGWLELDGSHYYFDEDHAMHTGWLETAEGTRYFSETGPMVTGWLDIGSDTYYFNEDGIRVTGWIEDNGSRCYLNDDGTLHTGWLVLEDLRYYFDASGVMHTGWALDGSDWYYLGKDGTPAIGWMEIDGGRYYFQETGIMHTGWIQEEDGLYYLSDEGTALTGWQDIEGKRYYFREDGAMHTGWLEQGEYSYYLNEDGTMATSPTQIGGRTYYFTPKGIHVMLVNRWNPMPENYELDLVEVERAYTVDRACYDALIKMLEACAADGHYPAISSGYRTEEYQQRIWNEYMDLFLADGCTYQASLDMTGKIVAVPGTSEHHLGLAVDIVGMNYYEPNNETYLYSTYRVQKWLVEHCWEYGFIYRYQEDKEEITGFQAESWHFRYVGTEVSLEMKDSGLCLEEYLGAVSVTPDA